MSQIVIGVDVGGTNTDAVLMEKNKVIAWAKHFTTDDVTTGVIYAITGAISNALESGYNGDICQVNIGTTHYINAVIQRKNLSRVAVIRLCGPASRGLPPFSDFDNELEKASSYSLQLFQKKYIFTNISFFILQVINPLSFMVAGGYQYDGSEIYPVDFKEISSCLSEIDEAGICNVVVSGVFSVVRSDQEIQVRDFILKQYPRFHVTISSEIGTMNLLERENAAILNECLKDLCHKTCQRFQKAFEELNLVCPIFYTQNDGTVLSNDKVRDFPVFTFSSGATNSMRGAVFLSGLKDGIVLDIGGTSSDVGLIQNGFPREASTEIKIGGVTTNFRMPDVISGALGGGTIVKENKQDVQIGPISVGFNISSMAKVFGGNTLTTTDVAVAAGIADIGDGTLVKDIGKDLIQKSMDNMHSKIEDLVDQVKISPEDLPLIVVGGGSIIFDARKEVRGVSKVVKPKNFNVANAVGAALTQIGGFVDEVMPKTTSIEELIEVARKKAIGNAVANGASEKDISIVSQSTIPLPYLPSTVFRVKIKVVGDKDECDSQKEKFVNLSSVSLKPGTELKPTTKSIKVDDALYKNDAKFTLVPAEPNVDPVTGEWELSEWDVECIAIGAGILGCGGGGSPHIGRLMLLKTIAEGKRPRVIHPERLMKNSKADDVALLVAYYGSPTVLCEKLTSGNQSNIAVSGLTDIYKNRIYQNGTLLNNDGLKIEEDGGVTYIADYRLVDQHKDMKTDDFREKNITCVYSAEIGGMNAIEPLVFGAKHNLPVVDVDGVGRAVPELQMVCPLIFGESFNPAIMVDVKGNMHVVLSAESNKKVEDHFRRIVVGYGCDGLLASAGVPVSKLGTVCVGGSVSRSWRIGNALLTSRYNNTSPFKSLTELENAEVICYGKIVNVTRKTIGGFSRGEIKISGFSPVDKEITRIEFQNENLIIISEHPDGTKEVKGVVPQLISIVDYDTCVPITTDMVEYGLKVAVLLLPPPAVLATDACLAALGPTVFGYEENSSIKQKTFAKEHYIPLP
ncbi:putative D-/L-hydantoinase subunit A [Nymphon striatum]|nr:putative D-/L-hydantoinase subunit A [Nymphon striatum]